MDSRCVDCSTEVSPAALRCKSCAARERWRIAHERGSAYGAKYPAATCKRCGREFPYGYKGRRAYCSPECRRHRVSKTCAGCGATFSVPVSNATRYTFCSRACSSKSRSEHRACARCGAQFWTPVASDRKHCCEECRRPPVRLECAHCGARFRTQPSKVGERRYCSNHCYRASSAESSIERTVREQLDALGLLHTSQAGIGPWTVDFLIGTLVIEADGDYWHSLDRDTDARKNADLVARGYDVWRLPEAEIVRDGFAERFAAGLRARGALVLEDEELHTAAAVAAVAVA